MAIESKTDHRVVRSATQAHLIHKHEVDVGHATPKPTHDVVVEVLIDEKANHAAPGAEPRASKRARKPAGDSADSTSVLTCPAAARRRARYSSISTRWWST
jgi:hypothetical protein